MGLLRIFIRLIYRLNQLAGVLAALLIIYMAGHILLEISLRLFGKSTFVANEFIGYAVAAMTLFGLGFALERDGLIRVDMLAERLPERLQRWLDAALCVLVLVIVSGIAHAWEITVIRSFQRHITSNSLVQTPMWIPQSLVLAGMILLCLTLISRVFQQLIPALALSTSEEKG